MALRVASAFASTAFCTSCARRSACNSGSNTVFLGGGSSAPQLTMNETDSDIVKIPSQPMCTSEPPALEGPSVQSFRTCSHSEFAHVSFCIADAGIHGALCRAVGGRHRDRGEDLSGCRHSRTGARLVGSDAGAYPQIVLGGYGGAAVR